MKPLQHGTRICHGSLMGKELYRTEDSYGVIVVSQRGNKRVLNFGSNLEQSSVLIDKPHYLIHEYTQIMLLGLLFVNTRDITILGLGGGGLAHCLSHYFPQTNIRIVEIRQAVIEIAHDWFDLPRSVNIHVLQDDALHYLSNFEKNKTDIIFSDLYEAEGMSECQAQEEFIIACHEALSDNGCLVLNFHNKPEPQSLLMHSIENLFIDIIEYDAGNGNCIMFCCKNIIALQQAELNTSAESLVQQVKMPLMFYYRKLEHYDSCSE